MYSLIRPLLFLLSPEAAHQRVLSWLRYVPDGFFAKPKAAAVKVMGLTFPHRVGLAAGFDKSGEYLDALAKLGFAFIEVGTVTPHPQAGHPKPRLFRLPQAEALINRMGFNNPGVEALVEHVKRAKYAGVLGINIGKNHATPLDNALEDYVLCLQKVYPYASYVAVNISSPNTAGLRQLQQGSYLDRLMSGLRDEQLHLADAHQRYVPLVIKISSDETEENLKRLASVVVRLGIEGIIISNTTLSRHGVEHLPFGTEIGGLSGRPLADRSTHGLKIIKEEVGEDVTLIGVGGIGDETSAKDKMQAGASLVQVYTGLIYQGPALIKRIADAADSVLPFVR